MVSRRRPRPKWQYLALLLVVLAFVIYFAFLRGDSDEQTAPQADVPAAPAARPASTESAPREAVPHEAVPREFVRGREPMPRQSSAIAVGRSPVRSGEMPEPAALERRSPTAPPPETVAAEPLPRVVPPAPPVVRADVRPPIPDLLFRSPADETAAEEASLGKHPPDTATPIGRDIAAGMELIESGRRIEGRVVLSEVLLNERSGLMADQSAAIRSTLTAINKDLVFSKRLVPGDPLMARHIVQQGNRLATIARMYKVPYQLIEHINQIKARRIYPGLLLKVIKGPIHAIVDKSDFRMDLFVSVPDHGRVYLRSFPVGIGVEDSTPLGSWIVGRNRKVANPAWANPRTGKLYSADDPQNPIGEYWIGLVGTNEENKDLSGYGIHGTIEPKTVGTRASMGCVRMFPEGIKMVFHMLTDGHSTVEIRP